MPETLSLMNSNTKKRKVTDPNDKSRVILGKKHMAITIDKQANIWNSRLLIVPFNAKIFCQQLSAILYTIESTFIRSPTWGYAIVLHAAVRLLAQAKP